MLIGLHTVESSSGRIHTCNSHPAGACWACWVRIFNEWMNISKVAGWHFDTGHPVRLSLLFHTISCLTHNMLPQCLCFWVLISATFFPDQLFETLCTVCVCACVCLLHACVTAALELLSLVITWNSTNSHLNRDCLGSATVIKIMEHNFKAWSEFVGQRKKKQTKKINTSVFILHKNDSFWDSSGRYLQCQPQAFTGPTCWNRKWKWHLHENDPHWE